MPDESRSRKFPNHERTVAVLIGVAESNSQTLAQFNSDPELARTVSGRVAYTVRSAVSEALNAAATHVAELATVSGWDIDARPTQVDEDRRADAIKALGCELTRLATGAMTRTVTYGEFENIRVKLMDLGFALGPAHALDMAAATRWADNS